MPKFQWILYLTLARELLTLAENKSVTDIESCYRSVISRAYYAAFGVAKNHLISIGVRIPREKAHAFVIKQFQDNIRNYQVIGNRLLTLRDLRNNADYDDNVFHVNTKAINAIRQSQEIINLINQL